MSKPLLHARVEFQDWLGRIWGSRSLDSLSTNASMFGRCLYVSARTHSRNQPFAGRCLGIPISVSVLARESS